MKSSLIKESPDTTVFNRGSIAEAKFRVYNKTLDKKLWSASFTLDPSVRTSLLKIAQDFYKSTDLTAPIFDILFIGSSTNYNWTPTSDMDLHVVIDVTKLNIDPSLTRSFMDGLAAKWNTGHQIEIKCHPVEVYLQDMRERNSTAALAREGASIFSLLRNCWVKQPNHQQLDIDKDKIRQKYQSIKTMISDFILKKDVDKLKKLMKAIRNYRDSGLTKSGEFGTENLVFKALRYTGELTKLKDAINSIYDKSVAINESVKLQGCDLSVYEKVKELGHFKIDDYIGLRIMRHQLTAAIENLKNAGLVTFDGKTVCLKTNSIPNSNSSPSVG